MDQKCPLSSMFLGLSLPVTGPQRMEVGATEIETSQQPPSSKA